MSYVAVVGSRCLPPSWAPRVSLVVSSLLARGHFIGSGGALGADLFALRALVSRGRSACEGSVVFLPGDISLAPSACRRWLSRFVSLGGRVVRGSARPGCSRSQFVSALFARSRRLVSSSSGVVAFVSGRSRGSGYTVRFGCLRVLPVVVFPVEGLSSLPSLGSGRWVPLNSWPGSFRWVSSR